MVNALDSQKLTCRLLYFAPRHGVGQDNAHWLVFVLECMSYLLSSLIVQGLWSTIIPCELLHLLSKT